MRVTGIAWYRWRRRSSTFGLAAKLAGREANKPTMHLQLVGCQREGGSRVAGDGADSADGGGGVGGGHGACWGDPLLTDSSIVVFIEKA